MLCKNVFGFSFSYEDITGSSLDVLTHTALHSDRRIPRTSLDVPPHPALQAVWGTPRVSQDPPWMSPRTQPSRQSVGSQGHPRILPGCPSTPSAPGSLEDPKGSSLDVHMHTALQAILRIPRTCQDPPLLSPHTALHAVQRIPRTSQDPHWMSPHAQPSRQSGGSQGHPRILPGYPHTQHSRQS